MQNIRTSLTFAVIALLVFASRAIPHPPNLTVTVAAALWAFAFLRDSKLAWLAPVLGMFLGDLYHGFQGTLFFVYTYGALFLIAELGRRFSPARGLFRWGAVTISGSAIFFVLTNLGVFFVDRLYPMTGAGLIECFVLAIPFWTSQLVADLVFSAVAYAVYKIAMPVELRQSEKAH